MSKNKPTTNLMPKTQDFCIDIPIYQEYDISQTSLEDIQGLINHAETIDAFCIECNQESVFHKLTKPYGTPRHSNNGPLPFRSISDNKDPEIEFRQDRNFELTFLCSRNQDHQMKFYFQIKSHKISKIGQYPPLAELHLKEIARYRKVLEQLEYSELARAIGLHAHGIGIGSFVYLRRIFENLIESAHQKAKNIDKWNEDNFQKSRMNEKISLLKDYLPQTLTNNANIYAILSKGIHDLTEAECLEYFSTIRLGIELILDEEIEKRQLEKKAKGLTDEIGRIHGQISDSK